MKFQMVVRSKRKPLHFKPLPLMKCCIFTATLNKSFPLGFANKLEFKAIHHTFVGIIEYWILFVLKVISPK